MTMNFIGLKVAARMYDHELYRAEGARRACMTMNFIGVKAAARMYDHELYRGEGRGGIAWERTF